MLLVSFKNDSEVRFTAKSSKVKTNCHRLRHRLAKNMWSREKKLSM